MINEAAHIKQAALAGLLFVSIFQFFNHAITANWLLSGPFILASLLNANVLLKHNLLNETHTRLTIMSLSLILLGLFANIISKQTALAADAVWFCQVIMISAIALPIRITLKLIGLALICLWSLSLVSNNILHNSMTALGLSIFSLLCIYVHQHVNKLTEQLRQSQTRDKLTNCILPEDFKHELDKAEQLFVRYGTPFTVVCIKYDNRLPTEALFDQWLKELVHLLKSRIRKTDILCRFNTQKFMLLLPSTSQDNAVLLTQDLEKSLDVYEFSYKTTHSINPKIDMSLHVFKKDERLDNWFNHLQSN